MIDPGVGTERAPVVILSGGHGLRRPRQRPLRSGRGAARRRAGGLSHRAPRRPRAPPAAASRDHLRGPRPVRAGRRAARGRAAAAVGGRTYRHTLVQLPGTEPVRVPAASRARSRTTTTSATRSPTSARSTSPMLGLGRARRAAAGRTPASGCARRTATRRPDEMLAVIGSEGFLEIAVRDGSARRRLGLDTGTLIRVEGGRRVTAAATLPARSPRVAGAARDRGRAHRRGGRRTPRRAAPGAHATPAGTSGHAAPGGPHDATARHAFDDVEHWSRSSTIPARDAWQKPREVVAALALGRARRSPISAPAPATSRRYLAAAVGPARHRARRRHRAGAGRPPAHACRAGGPREPGADPRLGRQPAPAARAARISS